VASNSIISNCQASIKLALEVRRSDEVQLWLKPNRIFFLNSAEAEPKPNFAVVPKQSWHLLSNPIDYWYIITIATLLCADKFLQVTFHYFLKEFKGRNIALKNKRSHFSLAILVSYWF
jgi:hypothetical protein